MWGEDLNRIGIILNFLAGFLLAPDLLGKERLLAYEDKLGKFLSEKDESLRDDLEVTFVLGKWYVLGIAIWHVVDLFWYSGLFWASTVAGFLLDPAWSFVAMLIALIYFRKILKYKLPIRTSLTDLARFILVGLIEGAFLILTYIIPVLIYSWLDKLIPWMQTKGRLATMLVPVGIVFFIVGNLLQFVATFIK
jgi:hypothetical protein